MKSMRGEGKRRSLERLVEKENTSKIFNASDDNILFVPTLHYGRSTRSCANTSFTPRHVLCKNFFFPARDKGFVISRKYSTQTTRDIIIISNKLNQLPLLRTTIISESILRAAISRNIVSTNRKSLSKRRSAANSSRLDT